MADYSLFHPVMDGVSQNMSKHVGCQGLVVLRRTRQAGPIQEDWKLAGPKLCLPSASKSTSRASRTLLSSWRWEVGEVPCLPGKPLISAHVNHHPGSHLSLVHPSLQASQVENLLLRRQVLFGHGGACKMRQNSWRNAGGVSPWKCTKEMAMRVPAWSFLPPCHTLTQCVICFPVSWHWSVTFPASARTKNSSRIQNICRPNFKFSKLQFVFKVAPTQHTTRYWQTRTIKMLLGQY